MVEAENNLTGGKRPDRKGSGQYAILRTLLDRGEISKKDIAAYLDMSPSFITQTANVMIEEGSILKSGETVQDKHLPGRKKELLRLNPDYRYVFGINLEAENTYIALCNLRAEAISLDTLNTKDYSSEDPNVLVKAIADRCLQMIEKANIASDRVLGCGLTILGRVDNINNIALDTYGVWKRAVKIETLFSQYLPFRVIAENNANALAVADLLFGQSRTCENVLYIKWIPGVGGAIVENGKLMVGSRFGAGEFGHIYVGAGNRLCRCGKRGCLETLLSVDALASFVRDEFEAGRTPNLSTSFQGDAELINESSFRKWIITGDEPVDRQIEKRLQLYAVKIANIINTISPERVVFFGRGFLECPEYYAYIRKTITKHCPLIREEDLVLTSFRDEYHYIGGAAVAINRLLLKECGI